MLKQSSKNILTSAFCDETEQIKDTVAPETSLISSNESINFGVSAAKFNYIKVDMILIGNMKLLFNNSHQKPFLTINFAFVSFPVSGILQQIN